MNANRRKSLQELVYRLEGIELDLESVKDEEQEAVDNTPENLRGTERYQQMEEYVETMDMIYYDIESIASTLREIIEA